MEKKKIKCIIGMLLAICIVTSCSKSNEENKLIKSLEEGLPVQARLDTRAIPNDLTCKLFVFWKNTGTTVYHFKEMIPLTNPELPYPMKFLDKELLNKSYRFLFVASPTIGSQMNVLSNQDTELTVGHTWNDVIIRSANEILDENYYYGILNKTGEEIISEGSINGQLKRIVGQLVLDIFRIDTNIEDPMDIESTSIASVIDRVYEIEMEFSHLTKDISFNDAGEIVEISNWQTPVVQKIKPDTILNFKVVLPQENNGLLISGQDVKGSVRIKGICGLTSSPKIRAKYTFRYIDTTPICEIPERVPGREGHEHTDDCYKNNQKALVLHLPQPSENTTLLSISPNHYTVNKAGIRLDRIIDLSVYTAYEIETTWGNEKTTTDNQK